MERTLSDAGLEFIAREEGFSATLYNDVAGHATIGFGHLVHLGSVNGKEPERYRNGITREQGLEILRRDAGVAQAAVNRLVPTVVLEQYEFDALVSWMFNLGASKVKDSTLLRRVNGQRFGDVPAEFKRWVFAGGARVEGLVKRREREAKLWSDGVY